ncbi:hypothetical protein E1286_11090 [Nonomuraea terrae]|uniref:Uncharacterized protein n=1 Tax=Nonomuraea terrae TaxID=2530383 RepID=A0A4R4Z0B7_9ACTN|nr:hypothetical protein [Nonomuraea terrae]TDD51243.1 hypothetical protein E1286_11090 [Nonomuraea terrae]
MTEKLIDVPRRLLAGVLALLALAAVIVLTALADGAMRPLPASAPAAEFSAERALRHLERFATRPRPIGSPASAQARGYLAGRARSASAGCRRAAPSSPCASRGRVASG